MFYKKSVPRNFTKFTAKHLCQSPFFNKVAGLFIKKETLAQVFSCEFCEISKSTFFTQHFWTTASVNILYIFKKTDLITERKVHTTAKSPFTYTEEIPKDIPTFIELVIKNTILLKK